MFFGNLFQVTLFGQFYTVPLGRLPGYFSIASLQNSIPKLGDRQWHRRNRNIAPRSWILIFDIFIKKEALCLYRFVHYYCVISVYGRLYHSFGRWYLTVSNLYSLLFLRIMQCIMSSRKMIAISEKTYHNLAEWGNLEDSFIAL